MRTLILILRILACILLLLAAAGVESWSVGTIRVHNGWAGLFLFVASFLP